MPRGEVLRTPGIAQCHPRGSEYLTPGLHGDAMTPFQSWYQSESRRQFLGRGVNAIGFAALASLLGEQKASADGDPTGLHAALPQTHFPAKAKNVIYLHMVGGPPQMDLYDYK